MTTAEFAALRELMVQEIGEYSAYVRDQIAKSSLDPQVLEVVGRVPRHEFVPAELRPYAYLNMPLPIGCGKTISQPFIVALMTDLLQVTKEDTVLEVGTGLGYQAAVMAELARQVYSIEIIEDLLTEARKRLERLGYQNIQTRLGDGALGWPAHAPFDKIIVTAAPDLIPPMLLQQLKPGGRMVIPTGLPESQKLVLVEKDAENRTAAHELIPVRFSALETEDAA